MVVFFRPQSNNLLTSLYRKGTSAPSSPASKATPLPPSAGALVSSGGFFIDKGRGPAGRNILIDLCEDESDSKAASVSNRGGEAGSLGFCEVMRN